MFTLAQTIFALHAFFIASARANCHFTVYAEENYGTGSGTHTYSSSCDAPFGGCTDIKELNDRVRSFKFQSNGHHVITLWKDAGCKGAFLGQSVGSWSKPNISKAAQEMSSFSLALYDF
ncbi:hypothetical protein BV22DRAFT_1034107 [Leucogyrophana mollusca]|uniref:Uncharacterized protein n=1 Tax=Leucogyrophana mollusca TaxID=85980 RepID=A0ACB8BHP5_9AGAM|nr:hypothetical protein BV22DRAFT_1034107 [Leucogyrophana mollusca]